MFPALQEEKRQQILKDFERTEVQYLYEYGATLYAGVKETVVFLYQKYDLFIVSNCKDGYVSAFLHAHNSTPYFKDTAMSGQTGLEKGSNIKNLMKKHGIREALIKSAAVDGERFFVKTRFEKRGNTVCISRFSNRRIGGKDPSSAVGDLFRGSLGRLYMLGIQQATKMHQKKPEFHSYGPDMDLEQRQTQTGSSVRYRS